MSMSLEVIPVTDEQLCWAFSNREPHFSTVDRIEMVTGTRGEGVTCKRCLKTR